MKMVWRTMMVRLTSQAMTMGKIVRSVGKDRPRKARKVPHTGKERKLVDEDDVEDNDGHAYITSNGEGHNTCDRVDCEVQKETTEKRKGQREERINDEHEEMDENCEHGPISKKKSTKESVVCGLASRDFAEYEAILNNERSKHDSFSVSRSSRVPLMIKDVPTTDEHCFSQVLKSMSGDGPQTKTLKKCKASCKLPNGTHRRGRKRNNTDIKNNIRKREAVDGSDGFGEMVLENDETFANFLSELKKRRLDHLEE